jgi:hypothetical protein
MFTGLFLCLKTPTYAGAELKVALSAAGKSSRNKIRCSAEIQETDRLLPVTDNGVTEIKARDQAFFRVSSRTPPTSAVKFVALSMRKFGLFRVGLI